MRKYITALQNSILCFLEEISELSLKHSEKLEELLCSKGFV
jgi:hypothetical protein